MTVEPGYGETPLDGDEWDALLPDVATRLGSVPLKSEVFDLEQAIYAEVATAHVTTVLDNQLTLNELLTDHFVRDLHKELYGDLWQWAGRYRNRELSIGIAPERIAEEVRSSLETIAYRWSHTDDWSAKAVAVATHAELTRIHPFTDGNGRSTRLLADLVYLATQDPSSVERFDWGVDKAEYITLLRQYDRDRDPQPLTDFLQTIELL